MCITSRINEYVGFSNSKRELIEVLNKKNAYISRSLWCTLLIESTLVCNLKPNTFFYYMR